MEHNAVLRPLYRLQKMRNITISFVPPDRDGIVRTPRIEAALRRDTALVVMTHVSNVTGAIMPAEEVGALCKKHGVPFLVDGAQAAGHIPVDIPELGADLYAFPGHKGLCGPQGTGGLYVSPAIRLSPLKYGGTGVLSRTVSIALPKLSLGISQQTYSTAYAPFTPSNSGQRSPPTYYRGCWHVVSRGFLLGYRHFLRPQGQRFTIRKPSSLTRRCWVRLSPIAQYSPLLPPVGVWAVSQSQCGRSPSQVGYPSSPWWAVIPPTS